MSAAVSAVALAACGGADSSADTPALTPAGEAGREVAKDAGCMSCHGGSGEGGVGPSWQGLAGSMRPLTDGTEVVADRAYLERAISDPGAEKVEGYAVAMPVAGLSPDQVSSIVDYLEELG
ncbi:MAG: c-type cytochrome [Acidimicrobiales bacterium]